MNNTGARNEALGQAALAYCAAHDISAHPIARAHCATFATAQGCTVETARRHLTRALNYTQRGPDAVPPGWGGTRPGAGRRHRNKTYTKGKTMDFTTISQIGEYAGMLRGAEAAAFADQEVWRHGPTRAIYVGDAQADAFIEANGNDYELLGTVQEVLYY